MPDDSEVGSVFGSVIRFSKSEIEVDQDTCLQRPRILALPKATVQGTIPMVARKRAGMSDIGSSPTAAALGGWRSGGGERRRSVAARSAKGLTLTEGTCVPE